MSKVNIQSVADLHGFTYDPATLPTAIILFEGGNDINVSVHALRAGEETLLKKMFDQAGVKIDEEGNFTSHKVVGFKFYEDAPNLSKLDWGMYYTSLEHRGEHKLRNVEKYATKQFADCA